MYIYTAHVLEESFSPDSFEIPPPSFASSLVGVFLLRRNIKTFCLSQINLRDFSFFLKFFIGSGRDGGICAITAPDSGRD